MKEICFTTFVFGSYQKYIPYYIFSISEVYPDSHIKIFVEKPINKNVIKCLDIIKENGYENFDIIIADFIDLSIFKEYKIRGGGYKTLYRWLFSYDYFKEFKYLYYGDIDIIILPEEVSLLEVHKNKMKEFQVPFSNTVRKNDTGKVTNRLTGLHFVEVKPYFDKMESIIYQITINEEFRKKIMKSVNRDEELLYEMNKIAFNFNEFVLSEFQRPIHGIHLGFLRIIKKIQEVKNHLNYHQCSLSQQELSDSLKIMYANKHFQKMSRVILLEEFYTLNSYLGIKNPLTWKIKILKNHLYDFTKGILKKVKKSL